MPRKAGIIKEGMEGMMEIEKHEAEEIEPEVRLWLEKKEIPYQRYMKLSAYNKVVLHNLVCTPTRPASDRQRKDLYKKLCLPDIAGRELIDPVDFMPVGELERFFSPLTPGERLPYLHKF